MAVMESFLPSFVFPLCVEARKMLEGLRLAHRLGFQKVQVFSNSLSLVSIMLNVTVEIDCCRSGDYNNSGYRGSTKTISTSHFHHHPQNVVELRQLVNLCNKFSNWIKHLVHCNRTNYVVNMTYFAK